MIVQLRFAKLMVATAITNGMIIQLPWLTPASLALAPLILLARLPHKLAALPAAARNVKAIIAAPLYVILMADIDICKPARLLAAAVVPVRPGRLINPANNHIILAPRQRASA